MKLSDFDYRLPAELIAQEALSKRTDARLLVLNRVSGSLTHLKFDDCLHLFEAGDVLVLNDTKVLPARLLGRKDTGGRVEALLLREQEPNHWEVLLKPSGRIHASQILSFGENGIRVSAKVLDTTHETTGIRHLVFTDSGNLKEDLNQIGHLPLPPYIRRADTARDREQYQTVFAKQPGAVASPTAGLHFDTALLDQFAGKGVRIVFVTLHVGYGTFRPVTCDDVSQHQMHSEYFCVPAETAHEINLAKSAGRRVIACGTTVVRALESAAVDMSPSKVAAKSGMTNLFITPPFRFRIPDAVMTNFHLPRTTLLMMVAAFCGEKQLFSVYGEAIRRRYRFYSYGDAMCVI